MDHGHYKSQDKRDSTSDYCISEIVMPSAGELKHCHEIGNPRHIQPDAFNSKVQRPEKSRNALNTHQMSIGKQK